MHCHTGIDRTACWDYPSCTGQTGVRGARNPNGIPDDYMSLLNPGASLVSPFVTRISPFDSIKTQQWNIVYVPYCTGDIYSGDKVAAYNDPADVKPPLVRHMSGRAYGESIAYALASPMQPSMAA